MRVTKTYILLAAIFIISLAARLVLAFRQPTLDYLAYVHLEQVHAIATTGMPVFTGLAFSPHYFIPGYEYILAAFSFFADPAIMLKIVPNIFASLIVPAVFLLSRRISGNETAALFSSLIAAFLPVFVVSTYNSASPFSLILPLMFFLLYFFIRVDEPRYAYAFSATSVVLALISPVFLFIVLSLAVYIVIAKAESVKRSPTEFEVVLFSGMFGLWVTFLVFKKPLILQGMAAVWQNVPSELFATSFASLNVIAMLYQMGIVASFAGLYVIYRLLLRQKKRELYIVMSPALTMLLLLGLGMIAQETALMVLGVTFAILFALFYVMFRSFVHKSRFNDIAVNSVFILLVLVTSVVPSFLLSFSQSNAPSPADVAAMAWLAQATPQNAVILASVDEGYLVTALANRSNVIDRSFFFSTDVDTRFTETRTIYTTGFETEALQLLSRYHITYIFLSSRTMRELGIADLSYVSDKACFSLIYNQGVRIYKVLCEVRTE